MDREVVDDRVVKHALAAAGGVARRLQIVHAHHEVADVNALVDGALDSLRVEEGDRSYAGLLPAVLPVVFRSAGHELEVLG